MTCLGAIVVVKMLRSMPFTSEFDPQIRANASAFSLNATLKSISRNYH